VGVIFDNLDIWRDGLVGTLILFLAGGVVAVVVGTVVGAMRVSPIPIARAMGTPQFLIALTAFCVLWMVYNTTAPDSIRFDSAAIGFTALTLILSVFLVVLMAYYMVTVARATKEQQA
jgi:uncharacterized membrane protein YkvI